MTEFQSRRELREAERNGLIPKPEQVFDLPTGQIKLPEETPTTLPDLPNASEMLTRKRIREMERLGLLDPLTGALLVPAESPEPAPETRAYDEVVAETEEPITSSIGVPTYVEPSPLSVPAAPTFETLASGDVAADIFHSMVATKRKPKVGLIILSIAVLLAGLAFGAYMLGIFE